MRNFVKALFVAGLASVGESLKTMVVFSFPKESEINEAVSHQQKLLSDKDVIFVQNPKTVDDFEKLMDQHRNEIGTFIAHSHGSKGEIPLMHLIESEKGLPFTEVISLANKYNKDSLKEIDLASCFIGMGVDQVKDQYIASDYYQKLQESLLDDQYLFLHGDQYTGVIAGSFGARLDGITQGREKDIFDLMTDSGEAMSVVTKKQGESSDNNLVIFSPKLFGRGDEEFTKANLLPYLDDLYKESAKFEIDSGILGEELQENINWNSS